jgi:hypothetical protein
MIPYLLAVAGGYLLGDSMKSSTPQFADGGMMADGGFMDGPRGEKFIRVGDYYIFITTDLGASWIWSEEHRKFPYTVTTREGVVAYRAKSLEDAKEWARSRYADGEAGY